MNITSLIPTPPQLAPRSKGGRCGLIGLAVAIGWLTGCRPEAGPTAPSVDPGTASVAATTVQTNAFLRFVVTGMHCDGCAGGIRSELLRTAGVGLADVRFASGEARVAFDTNQVAAEKLIRVIEEAGYQARVAP